MLVLTRQYYESWAACQHPAVKVWLKLWEEGLYAGTHPMWTFSPFSLGPLSDLWLLFQKTGKDDYGREQRRAIKRLAALRTGKPESIAGVNLPAATDPDSAWDGYFGLVRGNRPAVRTALFDAVREHLEQTWMEASLESLRDASEALAAELLWEGVSDRELFLRTAGVIGKHEVSPDQEMANVRGLLDHLNAGARKPFVAVTEITGGVVSRRLIKRVRARSITSLTEVTRPVEFIVFETRPCVGSLVPSTHSMSAFLEHRFRAWRVLAEAAAHKKRPDLSLASSTSVADASSTGSGPWRHEVNRKSLAAYIPPVQAGKQSLRYVHALEAAEDDPATAIAYLKAAFEELLGKQWWNPAAASYVCLLRRQLARDIHMGVREYEVRLGRTAFRPVWLDAVPENGWVDFAAVAETIRASGIHADLVLVGRLLQVADAKSASPGVAVVEALLALAQGVRNLEEHGSGWPSERRHIASYLAKCLLYIFAASFPKLK